MVEKEIRTLQASFVFDPCGFCGKSFLLSYDERCHVEVREKFFCSRSCAFKARWANREIRQRYLSSFQKRNMLGNNNPNYGNHKLKGIRIPASRKEKIRAALKGKPYTEKHKHNLRLGWKTPIAKEHARNAAVLRNRTGVYPMRNTSIEEKIQRMLRENGISYEVDAPLFGVARADVAVRKARIAIFADGCYWHGCPSCGFKDRTKSRDARQCFVLAANGWIPLRYWEHEINDGPRFAEITEEILALVRGRLIQQIPVMRDVS